jgi:glycosyltransferase involved in cell wall biosynthesis
LNAEVIKNSYSIQKNKNPLNKEYILWVSRCEVWKNPDIFIEFAGKCPEYSFVMICPAQKHQEEFFEVTKKQAREKKNLKFIDFVPFEDIQEYFDRALVFVGTSEYEGFPNTFLQSCMAYTPIVSYKVNPDDFINKHDLGYCASGDKGKLEDYLRKLLNDKKEWRKKSENAFKYIEKNHDINVNIEAWLRIIQA